jgi:hypothetical protein
MSASMNTPCSPGDRAAPERVRYFARQLLTPVDLKQEQDYFREKLRRHNRLLHGWGVVCGAKVTGVPDPAPENKGKWKPWLLTVSPGFILSPEGDEIFLDREFPLTLQPGSPVTAGPGEQLCQPEPETPANSQNPVLYVAVKYQQTLTRPVHVQAAGCGCGTTPCEPSRWRDAFAFGLLARLPESHAVPVNRTNNPLTDFNDILKGNLPECPPWPKDPWAVLAGVKFDSGSGNITEIDNCSNRRLVISFARYWRKCADLADKAAS